MNRWSKVLTIVFSFETDKPKPTGRLPTHLADYCQNEGERDADTPMYLKEYIFRFSSVSTVEFAFVLVGNLALIQLIILTVNSIYLLYY